ncbi:bifunctional aspartate kinase/homoserine dehydrogenase I [Aliikangiella sp. IMCC44632]
MRVLKFGGSSLASAQCFVNVVNIIQAAAAQTPLAIVLSAPQTITNEFDTLITQLSAGVDANPQFQTIKNKLQALVTELSQHLSQPEGQALADEFLKQINKLEELIKGIKLIGHIPNATQAQLISYGERFSVMLLKYLLSQSNYSTDLLDPLDFIQISQSSTEPVVQIGICQSQFTQRYPKIAHISLMPGFYAKDTNGDYAILGRNGSDYSAAILAACLAADSCEIWTDVSGVYNADPRLVKDAHIIKSMSYQEAMELSYFGAKVLHPKTIAPLAYHQIPCYIKNTNAPDSPGTLISDKVISHKSVKAISHLEDVAMINVSGPGMKGMVGMASRIFSAISLADISVILISQSSAEYAISFCVPGKESKAALSCLQDAFSLELKNALLDPISVKQNLSIITLVGDSMQQQKGVAAKFFKALSQASVNIIAIAQDSSERSISAVIRSQRYEDAVRVCHQQLFTQQSNIDVIVIGCGTVGTELISQIERQHAWLKEKNIGLNLVAIANSQSVIYASQGVSFNDWQQQLKNSSIPFEYSALKQFLSDSHLNNPVIVDCTSSEAIAQQYANYLNDGFHIVTANKKANTGPYEYYIALRQIAQNKPRRFLYETNVGAGLPVVDNLQGLFRAGDRLIAFSGILSGSLSYIFGVLSQGQSLSAATLKAKELGFTEPNPAEDLSGLDVARKVLVIAREAGIKLELEDIQLSGVVPPELANIDNAEEFLLRLPEYDHEFQQLVSRAQKESKVLRYIASINNGICRVGIQAVDESHPLYHVAEGENALAINTQYYQPRPFVIRGYGAGAEVTAAGLFSDILRTLVWETSH